MFKTRKLYWIICNLVDFIGAEMAVEESMKFYIAAPGNVPFSDDESCGIGSYELGFLGYFCCVKKRRGGGVMGGNVWGWFDWSCFVSQLEMEDDDVIEVYQEQTGGYS